MNKKDKVKVFEQELSYIHDKDIKDSASYLLGELPDYYYELDASSTGKYHPKYAQGKGGLSRHIKSAVKMAVSLLEDPSIGGIYSDRDKDFPIWDLGIQVLILMLCYLYQKSQWKSLFICVII